MTAPPNLNDLQGEWKIVSVGQNGGKAPFFIPWLMKPRLVVEGDRFTKYMGDRVVETGRLTVSQGAEFSQIDEHIESGDDNGKSHFGIIRWVGNKIEHLQGKVDGERPSGFPYAKSSMVGYAMMKRT